MCLAAPSRVHVIGIAYCLIFSKRMPTYWRRCSTRDNPLALTSKKAAEPYF